MFQTPALVLSLALVSTYAVLFLLVLGKGIRRLPVFWLASAAGFVGGQLLGRRFDLVPWTLGQVHIVEASLASILFLILAQWLAHEGKKP